MASCVVAARCSRYGRASDTIFMPPTARLPTSNRRIVSRYLPDSMSFCTYPRATSAASSRCVVLVCSPTAADRSLSAMPRGALDSASTISNSRSIDCTGECPFSMLVTFPNLSRGKDTLRPTFVQLYYNTPRASASMRIPGIKRIFSPRRRLSGKNLLTIFASFCYDGIEQIFAI